jgi:hypothetical protein
MDQMFQPHNTYFSSNFWTQKQHFLYHSIQIRAMSIYHGIQITLFLVQKVSQNLPRTFDHLQLTVSLHLTDKMYHLSHDDPDLVPIKL